MNDKQFAIQQQLNQLKKITKHTPTHTKLYLNKVCDVVLDEAFGGDLDLIVIDG